MVIQIEDNQLEQMLTEAAKKNASMALEAIGHFPRNKWVSEREAICILKFNGKNGSILERWIRNKEIEGKRSVPSTNSKIQYPREKLMKLIERGSRDSVSAIINH